MGAAFTGLGTSPEARSCSLLSISRSANLLIKDNFDASANSQITETTTFPPEGAAASGRLVFEKHKWEKCEM